MSTPKSIPGPSARRAAWLLAGAGVLLVMLTVALALGFEHLDRLDQAVAREGYYATSGHDGRRSWWVAVAACGQPMVLRAALVFASVVLASKRYRALALWLVGIAVAEILIAPAAKHLLNRPRPEWVRPLAVEHSLSYPVGPRRDGGHLRGRRDPRRPRRNESRTGSTDGRATCAAHRLCDLGGQDLPGRSLLQDVVAGNLLGLCITLAGWLVLLRFTRGRRGS